MSDKKLLTVFGATGQQGGSVINFVLNDPELSSQYTLRGITRDTTSPASQVLSQKGVEMISADPNDPSTLSAAMKNAHTVFAMTFPSFTDTMASELNQGRALADAALAANVKYYIFSTLPNVTQLSGGKYTKVAGFDGKARTEEYIRTLSPRMKSAFFAPGSFMQNFHAMMKPWKTPDGTYSMSRHVSPETKLPLIDIVGDTGKFIGAILADPDKFEGKTICGATKLYSLTEQAQILSKYTGKEVVYAQIPEEMMRKFLPPGPYVDGLIEMMSYQQDFGYYGEKTQELVAEGVEAARGRVGTFEEYLERNPLVLD